MIGDSPPLSWMNSQGDFLISTDPQLINLEVVYNYLVDESYWATDITREKVKRFVQHSLCFGVYYGSGKFDRQVGFARVITDFTTFAYLADVFILPAYQGYGLGVWLISTIMSHPKLQDLRKWTLNTRDAHGLYQKFGFQISTDQNTHMTYRPSNDARVT